MQSVKVKRETVIERIRENRRQHVETYQQALAVFRQEMIDAFGAALEKAQTLDPNDKDFPTLVNKQRPVSYEIYYDRALDALTVSVDDEITLEWDDFLQLMRDEWEWKREFVGNAMAYASKAEAFRR